MAMEQNNSVGAGEANHAGRRSGTKPGDAQSASPCIRRRRNTKERAAEHYSEVDGALSNSYHRNLCGRRRRGRTSSSGQDVEVMA